MILVDSSFWIEFFSGSSYGKIIRETKEYKERKFLVPTIIITEIYKKILSSQSKYHADLYR